MESPRLTQALETVKADPMGLDANLNLVSALVEVGLFEEAQRVAGHLIHIAPASQKSWAMAGAVFNGMGRYDIALPMHDRALQIAPGMATAHWNRYWANLALGKYKEAWHDQEHGRRNKLRPNRLIENEWKGEDLRGKTIFVWGEQGYGDVIQFARWLPRLRALGPKIVFEVYHPLKRLMEPLADVVTVQPDDFSTPFANWDYQVPLQSLPLRLGQLTDDWSIPEGKIFDIQGEPGDKVGFCWSGRKTHPNNGNRSLTDEEAKTMQRHVHVGFWTDVEPPFKMENGTGADFLATAQTLASLKELVTIDTAMAHLAGACGFPVKMIAPLNGEARWGMEGGQPWYQSMTIYRPQGSFDSVLSEIRAGLESAKKAPRTVKKPSAARLSGELSIEELAQAQQELDGFVKAKRGKKP